MSTEHLLCLSIYCNFKEFGNFLECLKMFASLFICFLSCFIFVETKPLMSVSQDFHIILSCNSTSSVDRRTLNMALIEKRFENNVDDNFKCFLYCLYREYKWMDNNGTFQFDEMRADLFESNLDESSKEYLLATCTETDVKDKCEKAYLFTECFWTEGEKLMRSDEPDISDYC